MYTVNTLLFDIDGTILDTREFILQATEHALSTKGFSIPARSFIQTCVGMPFSEFYFALTGSHDHADLLMETHRKWQYDHYHLSKIFPNGLETLTSLKRKGYKIAAVTTRGKATSIQTLADAGIITVFDVVISGDDAPELKPSSVPLIKALALLQESSQTAVMIGDSHLDIIAGKNAGTKTIRATYGFHTDHLHEPEPDFFIDNVKDLLTIFACV